MPLGHSLRNISVSKSFHKKKPEGTPRSAGPAPRVLAGGFASKGAVGPRAPQLPADREPRAVSLQRASLEKKKGKTRKTKLGFAMKETDTISDQNTRPKLFCLSPFQTSCWGKKKIK